MWLITPFMWIVLSVTIPENQAFSTSQTGNNKLIFSSRSIESRLDTTTNTGTTSTFLNGDSDNDSDVITLVEPILDDSWSRNPIKRIRHFVTNFDFTPEKTRVHDEAIAKTGGIWKSKFLGQPAYGMSAYLPDITKELVKLEAMGHLEPSWPESTTSLMGEQSLLMSSQSDSFQLGRQIFSEAISNKSILLNPSVLSGIQSKINDIALQWKEVASDPSKTTTIGNDVRTITYSVILTAIFGADGLSEEDETNFKEWTSSLAKGLFSLPIEKPILKRLPFFRRYARAMQARSEMKKVVEAKIELRQHAIEQIMKDGSEVQPTCMLDSFLLEGTLNKSKQGGDDSMLDFIVDNIILSIFAGFDTTTTVLSNLLLILNESATTDEIEQLRSELEAFDIHSPSLPNLPSGVLDAVPAVKSAVYESFRFRPAAGSTFRRVTKDVTLGKVQIPANSTINWNFVMGVNSPTLFESGTTRACPLRFLSTKEQPPMMFGYGKHMCPGQFLAQIEMVLVLKAFLCNFDFQLAPKQNTKPTIPFFAPKSGVELYLTRR